MSSPLVADSVTNQYHFPPLADSNSFGTVDNDTHIVTKIEDSINHVCNQ